MRDIISAARRQTLAECWLVKGKPVPRKEYCEPNDAEPEEVEEEDDDGEGA